MGERMKIGLNRLAAAGLIASACGGCHLDEWARNGFRVGPNYEPSPVPLSEQWIDYRTAATQPAPSQQPANFDRWWAVFSDPVLDSLMHDAYAQSLTLRAAGERILVARANRDIAIASLFPQLQQLGGSHTVNKQSDRTAFGQTNQWFQDVNVGFNVGWELDFWGQYRRAIEAGDAALDASIANFDDVMVLLLSDVASTYVQYRTYQQRLTFALRNVEIQRQSYELARANFQAGASTERDMQQARQVYEQTRALIPQLEVGLRRANNALCALLGIPVQDLSGRLGETGTIPNAETGVASGLPADLLRRRPDVRRAEREAATQSAIIGVTAAAFYPRFALNGTIGLNAEYIGGLWHTPGSMTGSFGPSFQWDILNYGRIESSVASQEARFRESVLRFQHVVLEANREAEDAIYALAKSSERVSLLIGSVAAAQRTVQITHDQYRAGAIDFTPVFLFELTLTTQEDELAIARGDIAQSVIALYRSVGGGWEARLSPEGIVGPPAPAPTTQPATRPALSPIDGMPPATQPP
jgi:NodT family efflux transporter outer membrane factor (OMF) lipoprotein